MPNCNYFLLILVTAALSCTSTKKSQSVINRKLPADALRKDIVLLKKILEANHPSLYWYTPKDSIDAGFTTVLASLTDSETTHEFRNKAAWLVAKIRCGHTAVRYPKKYVRALKHVRRPAFPLAFKTWDDSLSVVGTAYRTDTIFRRGTMIQSINGMFNRELLDSMFKLTSTDGYADVFKSQLISFNFPAFYRSCFGLQKINRIEYVDEDGNIRNALLPDYDPSKDTMQVTDTALFRQVPLQPNLPGRPTKIEDRKLTIDSATSSAVMQITSFSGAGQRRFYRRSFRKLHKLGTRHLVIDLRQNGGGNIGACTALTRYITDHSFRNADTVAAISRRLRYGRYIRPAFVYRLTMLFMSHKQEDGRFHLRYYERHIYKPVMRNHFSGSVAILQGGFTFSASCMFINHVQKQPNVTLIGEETGGGSYGNSAVLLPGIVLPNSRLRIVLPLYRVVFDHGKTKNGRGIFPDIPVRSTAESIRKGTDVKMDKAFELIRKAENK